MCRRRVSSPFLDKRVMKRTHDVALLLLLIVLCIALLGCVASERLAVVELRRQLEEQALNSGRALQQQANQPSCVLDAALGLGNPEEQAVLRAQLASAGVEPVGERLVQHGASASIAQDAFVRFHRLLYSRHWLPLSYWGIGRCAMGSSRYCGGGFRDAKLQAHHRASSRTYQASVVVRHAMSSFYKQVAPLVSPASTRDTILHARSKLRLSAAAHQDGAICLEWDMPQYSALIPSCTRGASWSFIYKAAAKPSARRAQLVGNATPGAIGLSARSEGRAYALIIDEGKRVLYGALWPDADLGKAEGAFDAIVCNEVFEHLPQPFHSATTLYRLLRPHGLVLFTVPFAAPFHGVPFDFFRYTADGATQVFTAAGFETVRAVKFGDSLVASGYLLGFGVGDFEAKHLAAHLVSNLSKEDDKDPDEWLYMGTGLVLRRPG